jgi:small subunit ribosomal protein S13
MAEERKPKDKGIKAEEKAHKEKPKVKEELLEEAIIRIQSFDIPGSKNILSGLTRIKGISWATSRAICKKLNIPKEKKISELSEKDINNIEEFLKNPDFPDFLKNRRKDPETGETEHLNGIDLDLRKDFDIKRMRKIKSYKGIRHTFKLPVRGQRTRGNFRKIGKAVGVKKSKIGKKG